MLIVDYDPKDNFPWIDALLKHNGENVYLKAKLDSGARISSVPEFWARELKLPPVRSLAKFIKTANMSDEPGDNELHSVYEVSFTLLATRGRNIDVNLRAVDLKRPYIILGWDFMKDYRVVLNGFEGVLGIYERLELSGEELQPI